MLSKVDAVNCCPFNSIGSQYTLLNEDELLNHLVTYGHKHMLLLLKSHIDLMDKVQCEDNIHLEEALDTMQPCAASNDSNLKDSLLSVLNKKIVLLEKINQEQDKNIELSNQSVSMKDHYIEKLNQMVNNLTLDIARTKEEILMLAFNGVHVWRLVQFTEHLKKMRETPLKPHFSPGFYTSSGGYKLCGRINLTADGQNLSLFIHIMLGDYDDTLIWPFFGHIALSLIHPRDPSQTVILKMNTSPELSAFKRISTENRNQSTNHIGFGYHDFVSIEEIFDKKFIDNDTIVIKLTVEC